MSAHNGNPSHVRCISPVDGSTYVERAAATGGEIDALLGRAAKAQIDWRATPIDERIALCDRMVAWMLDHADAIGEELAWQMGRPIAYGPMEIRRGFRERAQYMMFFGPEALADVELEPTPGFVRFIRRDPLGVVLVLAPWNYPFLCAVNAIVPSLIAGNTVVLKTASQTPLVAERWSAAFEAAGLPPGVFQHVHASHEAVATMIGDERVAFVAFTGSVDGGHAVQQAAAHRFISTGLELGGKDPAYVRADADLPRTIEELVDGSFFNSGQSCCASSASTSIEACTTSSSTGSSHSRASTSSATRSIRQPRSDRWCVPRRHHSCATRSTKPCSKARVR